MRRPPPRLVHRSLDRAEPGVAHPQLVDGRCEDEIAEQDRQGKLLERDDDDQREHEFHELREAAARANALATCGYRMWETINQASTTVRMGTITIVAVLI